MPEVLLIPIFGNIYSSYLQIRAITISLHTDLTERTKSYCQESEIGFSCTGCVCTYRNEYLNNAQQTDFDNYFDSRTSEAAQLFASFGSEIARRLLDYQINVLEPWKTQNFCTKSLSQSKIKANSGDTTAVSSKGKVMYPQILDLWWKCVSKEVCFQFSITLYSNENINEI